MNHKAGTMGLIKGSGIVEIGRVLIPKILKSGCVQQACAKIFDL
jgi:hypothetical protein